MKTLITGATGYIGSRLIPILAQEGHDLYLLVRDQKRVHLKEKEKEKAHFFEGNLLHKESLNSIPKDVDVAFYLVHSMSEKGKDFEELEIKAAENFKNYLETTSCKQIIFLSGIQDEKALSKHLRSRSKVEEVLKSGTIPVTILRAAIIIGSGSASFEIMRDLVEKLPVMIAPRWVKSLCQPIAIRDVLYYLKSVIGLEKSFSQTFDIGGPDVLSYKELLLQMANLRKLKRWIIDVPVLTPRLSSYWLLLVTKANFSLAKALVESLKHDVVCKDQRITEILPYKCLSYQDSLIKSFDKIDQTQVVSSWTDAVSSGTIRPDFLEHIQAPEKGCLKFAISLPLENPQKVYESFISLGGENGWYYMDWAWEMRGFIDKLLGGVGLRRGRVSRQELRIGDPLDFWRVLLIDPKKLRLLLYAEMKLPGEAWFEFAISEDKKSFTQTAIFRPLGVWGRLYWTLLFPIHYFLFRGLAQEIVKRSYKKNDL